MGQGQRELEVTVLSAQELKNVKLLGGAMDPYCVAWLYPHMKVAGAVNKGGGANPTWNSIITLVVEESLLEQGDAAVTVEIYNHGKLSNKLIGVAAIPLADVDGSGGAKAAAYKVRTKSGRPQGVINVAVKAGKVMSEADVAKYAAPTIGLPAMGTASGQYAQQQYYPQQYPQQQYYPQQYPQQQFQQAPAKRGGLGGLGGGAGLGLGAGLFGGLLLGSALDGGGGGGCGGGCGG